MHVKNKICSCQYFGYPCIKGFKTYLFVALMVSYIIKSKEYVLSKGYYSILLFILIV